MIKGDPMNDKPPDINPNALSIEEALFLSALLCGVRPDCPLIHRLQLFFCANFIVGKNNAEEDFQRSIETEVDRPGTTKYWCRVKRGVYELTPHGYDRAKNRFPNVSPLLSPADSIDKVSYMISGRYNSEYLLLERRGQQFTATIGNKRFTNIKEACGFLGFDTKNRSAPRVHYNLAIRHKFKAV
jgi:hypothetical protein